MTIEKLVDIQTVIDYLCSNTCAHYPEKNDECELCNKSWIDGLNSLPSASYCASSEEIDQAWDMLRDVYDIPDVPDKAKDIIGDVMLMLHQMIVRADESIITDFVTYQREQLRSHKIMELNSVDETMTHIFLRKTGKAYIEYLDKLGQFEVKPGKNGEDRTRDNEGPKLFGNRTIIEPGEQFIGEDLLKEALDHIADSDKMVDQFRDTTKKTDDDTISRAAAIDAVRKNTFRLTFAEEQNCEGHVVWSANAVYSDVMEGALLELPSAQPERTCVNCGRTANNGGWYADGRTRCPIEEHYALPKDGYCHLWEKRNFTDDDYPERREE